MNRVHQLLTGMTKKIRVLIADDHELIRKSVQALLEQQGDMEVVATAVNGEEALTLINHTHPDVVVMDVSMPRLNGIQATEQLLRRDNPPAVVILSMYTSPALVQEAVKKGASGYVFKRFATDELPLAIRSVHQGKLYLSQAIPLTATSSVAP